MESELPGPPHAADVKWEHCTRRGAQGDTLARKHQGEALTSRGSALLAAPCRQHTDIPAGRSAVGIQLAESQLGEPGSRLTPSSSGARETSGQTRRAREE